MRLPQKGEQFAGRFQVEHELGRGGFATVFQALDLTTMGRVALKVLHPGEAGYDREMRTRFQREVEIVGQLRDPHTVRLIAHGEEAGVLWAAFELVPGRDLAELLRSVGRLDAARAEHVLRQILMSLREAHRLGLIHRDLKPDNVRVFDGPEGPLTVKVLDFGIARSTDGGHPSATATGVLVGTPRYMSPEQLRGAALSPASDIYSAGLMTYELLAGPDALTGNSVMDQIERFAPGHRFRLPNATTDDLRLMQIIERMTEPEVGNRVGSADAVLSMLAGDRPAPPIGNPQGHPVNAPEPRDLTRLGVVLATLLAVIVALAAILMTRETSPPPAVVSPVVEKVANPLATAPPRAQIDEPESPPDLGENAPPRSCAQEPMDAAYGPGDSLPGHLYVPSSAVEKTPAGVVVLLADGGVNLREMVDYTGFRRIADDKGLIVWVPPPKLQEKVGFLSQSSWHPEARTASWELLQQIREEYCVTEAPVFVIAENSAGPVADELGATHGHEIAAIATSTVRYDRGGAPAPGDPPRPRIDFSPRVDRSRPFAGGPDYKGKGNLNSVRERHDRLRQEHACDEDTTPARLVSNAHGTCEEYSCEVPLVLCEVDARYWRQATWANPDASPISKFDYTSATWLFFERFLTPQAFPSPDADD